MEYYKGTKFDALEYTLINSGDTDFNDLRCFFCGGTEFDYSEKPVDNDNKEFDQSCNV